MKIKSEYVANWITGCYLVCWRYHHCSVIRHGLLISENSQHFMPLSHPSPSLRESLSCLTQVFFFFPHPFSWDAWKYHLFLFIASLKTRRVDASLYLNTNGPGFSWGVKYDRKHIASLEFQKGSSRMMSPEISLTLQGLTAVVIKGPDHRRKWEVVNGDVPFREPRHHHLASAPG